MAGDRCWICLSSDDDDDQWKKVCKCNLRAHEKCILQWAQTRDTDDPPRCPQCRAEIVIKKSRSLIVELRDLANSTLYSLLGGSALSIVLPGVLTNIVYQNLYEIGAWSVRTMCSTPLANVVLGPLWTVHHRLAPFALPLIPPTLLKRDVMPLSEFQRGIALPLVPMWLCSSGAISQVSSAILLGVLSTVPGKEKTPVVGVILARFFYRKLWKATVGIYLYYLAAKVHKATEKDEYTEAMHRLDELIDQNLAAQALNNGQRGDIEQEAQDIVQVLDEVADVEQHRDGRWLIGRDNFGMRIAQGLASPFIASSIGNLLGLIPRFAQMTVLNRNLLGLCLLVAVKDIIDVITAYKRANMETQKHVLNYDQVTVNDRTGGNSQSRILGWLLDWNRNFFNILDLNIHIGFN